MILERGTIKVQIIEVLPSAKRPKILSYELLRKNNSGKLEIFYGQISLDKTRLYSGIYKTWHDLSYNKADDSYELSLPGKTGTYFVHDEIIKLVDSFLMERVLLGGDE